MKKVIRKINKSILVVSLISASFSYAKNPYSLSLTKVLNKTSTTVESVKERELLTIKDINGSIIYKEEVRKSMIYPKGFDISSLPDGGYFFELENDKEIKTIPFKVDSNQVVFNYEKETTINKPDVFLKKNFIHVNKLAKNEEPIALSIYYVGNNRGTLVFAETIKNTKAIKKTYKIMRPSSGTYIVVINTDNKTYYKYFTQ